MGTVRYLGSKSRLIPHILNKLSLPTAEDRFIDLFCGTGVVAQASGLKGWKVAANDTLMVATTLTAAKLMCHSEVVFKKLGCYNKTIETLNQLKPVKSLFYREYSESGENEENMPRPYFSTANAKKIDAIRLQVRDWHRNGKIDLSEKTLLLADLIEAANRVASIAGTYGCFLKTLSPNAKTTILLRPRELNTHKILWSISLGEAVSAEMKNTDTVYIDPPYTKRQYAAYYHIPETLAADDEPVVAGITGLRPWKHKSSEFCYKRKAPGAFEKLLNSVPAKRILISYSSEGHISLDTLLNIARRYGRTSFTSFDNFSRYTSSKKSSQNAQKKLLTEYLIEINR